MMRPIRTTRSVPRRPASAFTLIELLVVMAIIAIVGAIVLAAFRGIAREARLSSGANTVVSALGNARALALKNNRLVLVAFRPRQLGEDNQVVEIVTAQWTGDTYVYDNDQGGYDILDRFQVIPGAPVRRLPRGIKVAGPLYAESDFSNASPDAQTEFRDDQWGTEAEFSKIRGLSTDEPAGRLIAVMFGPDGAVTPTNPRSSANAAYIDFKTGSSSFDPVFLDHNGASYNLSSYTGAYPSALALAEQYTADDEPVVTFVPFLAVYDDEEFRELSDTTTWSGAGGLPAFESDLRLYLSENASRIHFNSYTGVALR